MISLNVLFESEEIKIKKLNDVEKKKFIDKFKDASPKYKDNVIHAAFDKNIQIGGIVINLNPDPPKYGPVAESSISFLYVMPKYRGKGIANRLLQIPMESYETISLTTGRWSDDQSKHLYKKYGFRIVGGKGITKYWYWEK